MIKWVGSGLTFMAHAGPGPMFLKAGPGWTRQPRSHISANHVSDVVFNPVVGPIPIEGKFKDRRGRNSYWRVLQYLHVGPMMDLLPLVWGPRVNRGCGLGFLPTWVETRK